jgi:hypothetical protein
MLLAFDTGFNFAYMLVCIGVYTDNMLCSL